MNINTNIPTNRNSLYNVNNNASPLEIYNSESLSLEKLENLLAKNSNVDEVPVVKYVSELLFDAIDKGASDIHFEPYETSYRVRFRLDGVLQPVAEPPMHIAQQMTSRLKVMASIDIAEKRIPQDGRIQIPINAAQTIDCRVNTLPTLWGEKVVVRILDGNIDKLDIDCLGFNDKQKQQYIDALNKPQGLILVTGPTGSGKTTSLYTGLNLINRPEVNILTVEDPVEITLQGVNQVNVATKQGMTFATATRAFLRQDPDIMMVGEIRDLETAEIAVKASQTGHLVLSTLHTNDVAQTLIRLANIGIEPYNIASSATLIMAQRLLRKLCNHCKTLDTHWNSEQLQSIDYDNSVPAYKSVGCEKCNHQGYSGRVGIYQMVSIMPTLATMIMQGVNPEQFNEQCRKEGFIDLRQSGLEKVAMGITSIDEVLRVTMV